MSYVITIAAGVVVGQVFVRCVLPRLSFSSTLGCWLLRGFEAEERKRLKEIGKERKKLLRQGVIWVL